MAQLVLYDALTAAGADLGLTPFGARALHSLRLEKSFGTWAREYRPIYTPAEAGLDRFVAIDKGDFIGRAAVLRDRQQPPKRRLVTLVVDAADADAIGDEPVWHDGKVVGWVTSGGYGHALPSPSPLPTYLRARATTRRFRGRDSRRAASRSFGGAPALRSAG